MKPKYEQKEKLCYMDTNIFIVYHLKTGDVYEDIADDVEVRFDALNYGLDRTLPKGKS